MKLYWLDLESSGLSPQRDDILEVAVSVAGLERPFDARPIYHAVLKDLKAEIIRRIVDKELPVIRYANGEAV